MTKSPAGIVATEEEILSVLLLPHLPYVLGSNPWNVHVGTIARLRFPTARP